MFSEQTTQKAPLLVCFVARVCLSAKDAEEELQHSITDYKLTVHEQTEVRQLMKEYKRG